MTMREEMRDVRRGLTLTEIGVVASLIISVGTVLFTGGVVYGQVQRNTQDIAEMKPSISELKERLARIDENVSFLKEKAQSEDRR